MTFGLSKRIEITQESSTKNMQTRQQAQEKTRVSQVAIGLG